MKRELLLIKMCVSVYYYSEKRKEQGDIFNLQGKQRGYQRKKTRNSCHIIQSSCFHKRLLKAKIIRKDS